MAVHEEQHHPAGAMARGGGAFANVICFAFCAGEAWGDGFFGWEFYFGHAANFHAGGIVGMVKLIVVIIGGWKEELVGGDRCCGSRPFDIESAAFVGGAKEKPAIIRRNVWVH